MWPVGPGYSYQTAQAPYGAMLTNPRQIPSPLIFAVIFKQMEKENLLSVLHPNPPAGVALV